MFKKFAGILLMVYATALPIAADTVTGSVETPDGEFKWSIVLTPTGQPNFYQCTVEVTKTSTNELVFAPAVTFEAGKPIVADDTGGEYTSKLTIKADPATGSAMVDIEIRKG